MKCLGSPELNGVSSLVLEMGLVDMALIERRGVTAWYSVVLCLAGLPMAARSSLFIDDRDESRDRRP